MVSLLKFIIGALSSALVGGFVTLWYFGGIGDLNEAVRDVATHSEKSPTAWEIRADIESRAGMATTLYWQSEDPESNSRFVQRVYDLLSDEHPNLVDHTAFYKYVSPLEDAWPELSAEKQRRVLALVRSTAARVSEEGGSAWQVELELRNEFETFLDPVEVLEYDYRVGSLQTPSRGTYQTHHIVPQGVPSRTAYSASLNRRLLQNNKVNIQNSVNGVHVPSNAAKAARFRSPTTTHHGTGLHTERIQGMINQRLVNALGGRATGSTSARNSLVRELYKIGDEIIAGSFPKPGF